MNSTIHKEITLQDINDEHIKQLVAPIVFLAILLTLGVPGNLTVLIIYGQKYTKSVYRSIIWNLAVVDLAFCAIGIPFNIARVANFYTFYGLWVCKIFASLLIFGIMYSTQLLLLLSFHRFRQVCMPLKSQITTGNVHRLIVVCFVIALFLTWPEVALENLEDVQLARNLTGHVCPITSSKPTVYWIAYSIFLLCLFVFYTVFLVVIYSLIGRKIYLQRNTPLRQTGETLTQPFPGKMTKIALTISVIFALSYIPLFTLKITKELIDETKLNDFEFSILRISERLYVINHVANPFIYAAFDNRFRHHFKRFVTFKFRARQEQDQPSSTITTTQTSDSEHHF